MVTRGTRNSVELLGGNPLFDSTPVAQTDKRHIVQVGPRNVLQLTVALTRAADVFLQTYAVDAYLALRHFRGTPGLLRLLLENGHSDIAGRLAGTFRAAHQPLVADDILATMRDAGFHVAEYNPFHVELPQLGG
jgi:hypothetical protein